MYFCPTKIYINIYMYVHLCLSLFVYVSVCISVSLGCLGSAALFLAFLCFLRGPLPRSSGFGGACLQWVTRCLPRFHLLLDRRSSSLLRFLLFFDLFFLFRPLISNRKPLSQELLASAPVGGSSSLLPSLLELSVSSLSHFLLHHGFNGCLFRLFSLSPVFSQRQSSCLSRSCCICLALFAGNHPRSVSSDPDRAQSSSLSPRLLAASVPRAKRATDLSCSSRSSGACSSRSSSACSSRSSSACSSRSSSACSSSSSGGLAVEWRSERRPRTPRLSVLSAFLLADAFRVCRLGDLDVCWRLRRRNRSRPRDPPGDLHCLRVKRLFESPFHLDERGSSTRFHSQLLDTYTQTCAYARKPCIHIYGL
ncbi:hypothetical protein TGARI_215010A [Toxoplasma gondii ARI]|uniref:Transmembrane protein n=1 Tax=Toxoplasma gondii ARI TaxID=1074872 RepID=A0A139XVV3_TOXGO|nr:hypothetical protein TGARI_215010A [Toxoplasma gondii ARI]